jgi:hypothetical protein
VVIFGIVSYFVLCNDQGGHDLLNFLRRYLVIVVMQLFLWTYFVLFYLGAYFDFNFFFGILSVLR